MQTILLMNAKGGCGKTTLATNIATWFADDGAKVALADYDPQGSALDWLQAREAYEGIPAIEPLDASKGSAKPARGTEVLVIDAPAGTHGNSINQLLRRVDEVIVPVLPSAIDMRACNRFLSELLGSGRISRKQTRLAVVANRVRENTRVYQQLSDYLGHLELPFLTHLRESQAYIRAAESGLGIFELAPSLVWQDVVQWDPVFDWLRQR
ncbi:MAG: AAA family ATPase [Gammaproteobacteria bacterium]|nr:AAA family ATPase [Gammaproteobacteria bacterium]